MAGLNLKDLVPTSSGPGPISSSSGISHKSAAKGSSGSSSLHPAKRSRKAINCQPCRSSKLKCDRSVNPLNSLVQLSSIIRARPCSSCVLRGLLPLRTSFFVSCLRLRHNCSLLSRWAPWSWYFFPHRLCKVRSSNRDPENPPGSLSLGSSFSRKQTIHYQTRSRQQHGLDPPITFRSGLRLQSPIHTSASSFSRFFGNTNGRRSLCRSNFFCVQPVRSQSQLSSTGFHLVSNSVIRIPRLLRVMYSQDQNHSP